MPDEPTTPEPQSESKLNRSLTGDIIIATGAALSGPFGALTSHVLSDDGEESEPQPAEIELPPGVEVDD